MTYTSARSDVDLAPSNATAWVGWIVFAACMMVLAGMLDVVWGIVALARDQVFIVGRQGNVIDLDYTAWGWINLIFGIVVLCAGFALLKGSVWAAITAVTIAVVSVIDNLFVIPAYPIWSVVVIALDVLVIYAITVHGDEIRQV
jgi:hypothetical protein